MPRRRHLDLPDLKPLAARLAIAIKLESRTLDRMDEPSRKRHALVVGAMALAADKLQAESGPLDIALKRVSDAALSEVIEGEGDAFDDLRQRVRNLANELGQVNCRKCARSKSRVCQGQPAQDEAIDTGGRCIAQLHEVLQFVEAQTRKIYADTTGATGRFPNIKLSTQPTHEEQNQDLFARFKISAFCDLENDAALTTFVGLVIRDRTVDWETLCGVPYLLTHEVVCHAFQTLHTGKRDNADEKCPWSEGWMDRLAYRLTHYWLSGRSKARFPQWLLAGRTRVEGQTNEIHEWRYKPRGTLPSLDAGQLEDARAAFDLLEEYWGPGTPLDRHRVAKFSARLNACDTINDRRQDIVLALGGILRGTDNELGCLRAELALRHCSRFVEAGDPDELFNGLINIRNLDSAGLLAGLGHLF